MSRRQQMIDRLMLQLDVQSRSIRMTRAETSKAEEVRKKVMKKIEIN